MGVYYDLVNPAKKQFLEPGPFLDGNKFDEVLEHGYTLRALKELIADNSRGSLSFRGAWLGDPVILAADDDGKSNPVGIQTTSQDSPQRNLNQLAYDQYTNISFRLLAEMLLEQEIRDDYIRRAHDDADAFVYLVQMARQYPKSKLIPILEKAFGSTWETEIFEQQSRNRADRRSFPQVAWELF